jgi:hypothetical protein
MQHGSILRVLNALRERDVLATEDNDHDYDSGQSMWERGQSVGDADGDWSDVAVAVSKCVEGTQGLLLVSCCVVCTYIHTDHKCIHTCI